MENYTKVSLALFVVAAVLFVLGFGSPWWLKDSESYRGLFLGCWTYPRLECVSYAQIYHLLPAKFRAPLAMCCLALVMYVVALIMYILNCTKRVNVTGAAVCCGIAGLLTLIGVAVFGSIYSQYTILLVDYGWSFGFICTSCCISFVNVVITLCMQHAAKVNERKGVRAPMGNNNAPPAVVYIVQ